MAKFLRRSIREAIREDLKYSERWDGTDRGLIWCWEHGRQIAMTDPDLAKRACEGELVPIDWKRGSLQYLAQWQGLRGEDLDLSLDDKRPIVCSKTKKKYVFKPGVIKDDDDDEE